MREIKIGGIYRHFKGRYYLVEALAENTETNEEMVIYRSLYGGGKLWARPVKMFLEEIDREKYPDSEQRRRFELQEID